MKSEPFPYLETEAFTAYIADNEPLGIHRRGYNGVAALIPRHSGNNLFVPTDAGLNYENISLAGMPAYRYEPRKEEHQSIFEPRLHLGPLPGRQGLSRPRRHFERG